MALDSRGSELVIVTNREVVWADPRLAGPVIGDYKSVWAPRMSVEVRSVNETRYPQELEEEVTSRLEPRSSTVEDGAALVDGNGDFELQYSSVRCVALDFAGGCDLGGGRGCGPIQRVRQTSVIDVDEADYHRFPFDRHVFSVRFGFADPYSAVPQEQHATWGLSPPLQVTWSDDSSSPESTWENSDGTSTRVPTSLFSSLEALNVPGFAADVNVAYDAGSNGGGYTLRVALRRTPDLFLLNYALPVVLLTFVCTLVANVNHVGALQPRNFVCVLSLLTGAFLANGAAARSPQTAQITWFDQLLVLSVITAFLALCETFTAATLTHNNKKEIAESLDRAWRRFYPLMYIAWIVFICVFSLSNLPKRASVPVGFLPVLAVLIWMCVCIFWEVQKLSGPKPPRYDRVPTPPPPLIESHIDERGIAHARPDFDQILMGGCTPTPSPDVPVSPNSDPVRWVKGSSGKNWYHEPEVGVTVPTPAPERRAFHQ